MLMFEMIFDSKVVALVFSAGVDVQESYLERPLVL